MLIKIFFVYLQYNTGFGALIIKFLDISIVVQQKRLTNSVNSYPTKCSSMSLSYNDCNEQVGRLQRRGGRGGGRETLQSARTKHTVQQKEFWSVLLSTIFVLTLKNFLFCFWLTI